MALTLTNTQKAAVLVLQLGEERAAKVLGQLSDTEVEEISAEIVRMEDIRPEVAREVVRYFHGKVFGGGPSTGRGGMEFAQRLLAASLGDEKAQIVMDRLSTLLAGQPFDFLQRADGAQVSSLLQGEHPQTVALVLAHLRAERASAIIAGLPPEQRTDIAYRIATMDQSSPEVVSIVAENLHRKGTSLLTQGEYASVGGVQPLVDILTRSDPGTEKQVLEELANRDADLAEQVRSQLFTFEDVVLLEDRAVQLVMRGVEIATLAVALKGAPPAVHSKVTSNLSERMRENLQDEADVVGPVRMSQVQEARGAIVSLIRKHEDAGEIVIRRDSEDDLVE